MAPHSSTLSWKIPWMEEPGRLQSMGSLIVGNDWATSLSLFTFMHWRRKWQPTPVFWLGDLRGGRAWGLTSMGSHRVGQEWSDLAVAVEKLNFFLKWWLLDSKSQSLCVPKAGSEDDHILPNTVSWDQNLVQAGWCPCEPSQDPNSRSKIFFCFCFLLYVFLKIIFLQY